MNQASQSVKGRPSVSVRAKKIFRDPRRAVATLSSVEDSARSTGAALRSRAGPADGRGELHVRFTGEDAGRYSAGIRPGDLGDAGRMGTVMGGNPDWPRRLDIRCLTQGPAHSVATDHTTTSHMEGRRGSRKHPLGTQKRDADCGRSGGAFGGIQSVDARRLRHQRNQANAEAARHAGRSLRTLAAMRSGARHTSKISANSKTAWGRPT